jgi:TP901 family phage tail tape measure protein
VSQVGLGINFTARDLASGPIGVLRGNFSQLHNAVRGGMTRLVGGFATLAAGAGLLTAGIETFRRTFNFAQAAGEFETAMAAVQSITSATTEQFENLQVAAIEASLATQFAPAEAARGLQVLAQQGLIAEDAIGALGATLDFATAGEIQVSEAAEVLMGTLNAYGRTVEDITEVSDRLITGTQISALSAQEFITVIGRAASTASLFNQGLDQMIIALGSTRSAGIPATVATTALTQAYNRLATDENTRNMIAREGVELIDQETGRFRDFLTIMNEYGRAISDRTEAEQAQLVAEAFRIRGMRTFNAISNIQARVMRDGQVQTLRGADAIAHYTNRLETSGGATRRFRDRQLATFAGQMRLLAGTLDAFANQMGLTFGPLFRPLVLFVTESINRFIRAMRLLPESARIALAAITLGTAAFSIFGGVVLIVVGAVLLLVTLLGELLLVVLAVGAGLAIAFIPILAMWGALAAGVVFLYRAWEDNLGGLADFVEGFVSRIRLLWNGLVQLFTEGRFSGETMRELRRAEGLRTFIVDVWRLGVRAQKGWNAFRVTMGAVWRSLAPWFEQLQEALAGLFAELARAFGPTGAAVQAGANIPTARFAEWGALLAHTLTPALQGMVYGLTLAVRAIRWLVGAYNTIRPVLEAVGNFLITMGTAMRDAYAAVIPILAQVFAGLQRIWGLIARIPALPPAAQAFLGLISGGPRRPPTAVVRTAGTTTMPTAEAATAEALRREGAARRAEQAKARTEGGTARPAATAARGGAGGRGEAAEATRELTREVRQQGRRGQPLQVRTTVEVDGNAIAESQETVHARRAAMGGAVEG